MWLVRARRECTSGRGGRACGCTLAPYGCNVACCGLGALRCRTAAAPPPVRSANSCNGDPRRMHARRFSDARSTPAGRATITNVARIPSRSRFATRAPTAGARIRGDARARRVERQPRLRVTHVLPEYRRGRHRGIAAVACRESTGLVFPRLGTGTKRLQASRNAPVHVVSRRCAAPAATPPRRSRRDRAPTSCLRTPHYPVRALGNALRMAASRNMETVTGPTPSNRWHRVRYAGRRLG